MGPMSHPKDGLTGLNTYRALVDAQIPPEGVIGVVFDIAGLRWVNVQFGLPSGDQTVQRVARLLSERCAARGVEPIRYAGDEFLVLTPGCSVASARDFAREVIDLCAALRLPHRAEGTSRDVVMLNALILRVFPQTLASSQTLSEMVASQLDAQRVRSGEDVGHIAIAETAEPADGLA